MQRNLVLGVPIILPTSDVVADEDVLIGTKSGDADFSFDLPVFDGKA
jgi:hypothetical protein